jgi:hypothetical protein
VTQHLRDWHQAQKLKPANGGSYSKLNEQQTRYLDQHLQANTYSFHGCSAPNDGHQSQLWLDQKGS